MNVLVIENEKPAAERIVRLLKKTDKNITIAAIIETVEGTINWLHENPAPDLILMDIQLDDGLCFEIFEMVNIETPVIFTTAYDEYMLKAFKVNSVDYLLKPVDEAMLSVAINKFKNIHQGKLPSSNDFTRMVQEGLNNYKSRFLVKIGVRYKSIPVNEISYFHISERCTFLNTMHGNDYGIDFSLEKLQSMLDPTIFFRINRNCIINISMVTDMVHYSTSRLQLIVKNTDKSDLFVVSRDKVTEFKNWVDR
jgi:DNA-binding LytR/AlgR family response regulator